MAKLILSNDSAYLSDSDAARIAGLMTDNVHLAASTLAAEQVIFGVTCGHPFLLHHLGSAIALAPDPLSGEDLRWHLQLYDIQKSLLPAIYTDTTIPEDTPAPRNYLRQLFWRRGVYPTRRAWRR